MKATSSPSLYNEFVKKARWPNGIRCTHCESERITELKRGNKFECNTCQHQFTITSQSFMHKTYLPLNNWILAMYLILTSEGTISAIQLARDLQLPYKTAWHLKRKLIYYTQIKHNFDIQQWLERGLRTKDSEI